jgi:ferredoxin
MVKYEHICMGCECGYCKSRCPACAIQDFMERLEAKNTLKMHSTPGQSYGLMLTNTDYEAIQAELLGEK